MHLCLCSGKLVCWRTLLLSCTAGPVLLVSCSACSPGLPLSVIWKPVGPDHLLSQLTPVCLPPHCTGFIGELRQVTSLRGVVASTPKASTDVVPLYSHLPWARQATNTEILVRMRTGVIGVKNIQLLILLWGLVDLWGHRESYKRLTVKRQLARGNDSFTLQIED